MKNLKKISIVLSTWALYVNALTDNTVNDVCDVLTSLSTEDLMLTRFNAIFFENFKAGANAGSDGSVAIGGSFTGDNVFFNQRNTLPCSESLGLVLQGKSNSNQIRVNGDTLAQEEDHALESQCALQKMDINKFNFNQVSSRAKHLSLHLAGLHPNYSMDKLGVISKIMAEGVSKKPYHVFTTPTYCVSNKCASKSFFQCAKDRICEIPQVALSDIQSMMLGDGHWSGPLNYPTDELVIFNIPVMNGETLNIQTKNPSAGLNGCNTIFNFYAVSDQGFYIEHGRFTIERNSEDPLAGFILAPQADIIDNPTGSFSGQVVANSYESKDDGVVIHDYTSGNQQCKAFSACNKA